MSGSTNLTELRARWLELQGEVFDIATTLGGLAPVGTEVSPLESLATPEQVAEYLHTTVGALGSLRYEGKGPKYIKMTGNKVRYRWSDVSKWLDERVETQTGQT